MTDEPTNVMAGGESEVAVALPDDRNPAIIDARKAFIITVVSAALFIGAVFIFIL